jgi:hypothetical protein
VSTTTPCPRELGGCHVIRWLSLNSSTSREFDGHPIEGVAICHAEGQDAYYVFGCDKNWQTLTDTWHQTFVEAQLQADSEYPGSQGRWVSVL